MLLSMPARGWNLLVSSPFPSYLLTMVSKVLFFFVFFFLLDFGGVFLRVLARNYMQIIFCREMSAVPLWVCV